MPVVDALLALVCWGFRAFCPKLASKHLPDPFSGLVFQYMGSMVCMTVYGAARSSLVPTWHPRGALFAALAGVMGTLGTAFYYRAASRAPLSVVAVTTGLYPFVSVLLALAILGEKLNGRQWIGAGLALVAVALLVPAR